MSASFQVQGELPVQRDGHEIASVPARMPCSIGSLGGEVGMNAREAGKKFTMLSLGKLQRKNVQQFHFVHAITSAEITWTK